MLHSFVGIIIQVDEQRFPSFGQGFVVNGKTMILGSDIGFIGAHLQNGLIMASMPVFEFVGVGSGGQGHQLVSKADPERWEYRLRKLWQGFRW